MGERPEGTRRRAAVFGLCLLIGAPFAFAFARADGSERGQVMLRMTIVLAIATVPPLLGRWRARRDAARGISPASHRVTGAGLRDALAIVLGAVMIGFGLLALFGEPADGDGLNPAIPFAIGTLLVLTGIANGRRQRR